MATNPILSELNSLSPGAKAALNAAHQSATSQAMLQTQQPSLTATIPPVGMQPPGARTVPSIGQPSSAQRPQSIPAPPLRMQAAGAGPQVPAIGLGTAAANAAPPTMQIPAGMSKAQDAKYLPSFGNGGMTASMDIPQNASVAQLGMPAPQMPRVEYGGRGSVQGDTDYLAQKESKPAALESIFGRISNSQFGQNHPIAGRIIGALAQIPATAADVALSGVAPRVGAFVPGTSVKHGLEVMHAENQLAQTADNQEKQAQSGEINANAAHLREETNEMPQHSALEQALTQAQIANLTAETAQHNAAVQSGPDLATAYAHAVNDSLKNGRDPSTDPVVQHLADAITSIQKQPTTAGTKTVQLEIGGKPHQVLVDERTGRQIADLGESGEKPPTVSLNQGTWSLQEDGSGNPVLFNSKTGQTQAAPNIAKPGTHAKAQEPVTEAQSNLQLARQLAANPSATNDYALLMTFIGGTKPEGLGKLRLNQNEVALAQGTRSMLGNMDALAQRLSSGQTLTADQRKQMIGTLQMVTQATERRVNGNSGQQAPPAIQVGQRVKLKNGQTITVKAVHPDGSFE